MEKKNQPKTDDLSRRQTIAADDLPGAAVDIADDCQVNDSLVDERTKALNNNPGNDYSAT